MEEIITPKHLSYILGNPPFLGHHYQNTQQKEDLENVFFGRKGIKVLGLMLRVGIKSCRIYRTSNRFEN